MQNEFCTCGARLPEDARFCHKCGKPQREEDVAEATPVAEVAIPAPNLVPPPVAVAAPVPISFRNGVAVRIGAMVSLAVVLLLSVPLPPLFQQLWLLIVFVAAGFVSVYLYRRRTGTYLSVKSGARLGWITGIFCFLLILMMLTLVVAALTGSEEMRRVFADTLVSRGGAEAAGDLQKSLTNPSSILQTVLASFLIAALLPTAGGALGAKILDQES